MCQLCVCVCEVRQFPYSIIQTEQLCETQKDGESLTGADVPQDPETKQSQ